MEFRVLGPLEVVDGSGRSVELGRPKQRALLALLLLHPQEVVSVGAILEGLWWGDPPPSAVNSVQGYVSRLRKALRPDVELATVSPGYRLEVLPECLDVGRFEQLARDGRSALAGGDPVTAAELLGMARRLVRGRPLDEFADCPFAPVAQVRLDGMVRAVHDAAIAARLRLGEHAQLVPELEALIAVDPVDEGRWGLLMTALYRSGRQVDALATFRRARQVLIERCGVEPGPELRALESRILAQSLRPTSAAPRMNLPRRLSSFVGRDVEVGEIVARIGEARLVTLTGPGGCGKTTLAVAVAERAATRHPDGVWFIDLTRVVEPDRVAGVVAGSLELSVRRGQSLDESIGDFLADQSALLVFDNCEHVIEAAAALIEGVVRVAPGVHVLATSRERLGVVGEVNCIVPAMTICDAVQLFGERARSVWSAFAGSTDRTAAAVERVCERVDRMPLAIELAAARVHALSVEEISARLDGSLGLLEEGVRGAAPRHRTLRSTLDWSYNLLSTAEQRLFQLLAVFAGGFTLQSVEAVGARCGLPAEDVVGLFARLIDKSLVVHADGVVEAEPRYRLLETMREYAADRLAATPSLATSARRAHATHFVAVAEAAEPHLHEAGSRTWFDRLAIEDENMRSAMRCAFDGGASDLGARLVGALQWSWFIDGRAAVGRVWAVVALAATRGERTVLRGRVLIAAAFLASAQSDLEQMVVYATELRALGEELDSAVLLANALDMLAISEWAQGRPHEAVGLHRESIKLYSSIGDRWDEAAALAELGRTLVDLGDIDEARRTLDLAVRKARLLGEDAALGFTLDASAALAVTTGELDDASRLIDEAVRHYRLSGYQEGLASGLNTAGLVASARREWDCAGEAFVEALGVVRRIGHLGAATTALSGLARVEHARADATRAAVMCAAAAAMRGRAGAEVSAHEQDELNAFRSRLRNELGAVAFEDAWATGGALTLDRAATLAGAG